MQEVALETAINSIRVRFGSQALTRAAEMPPPQPWSSGTPVDQLTGIGGLPRGRLSLFTGSGTSGKLTVALSLLAQATHEFAHAMVIDGGGFDPWMLIPFSPEPGALNVVRAPAPEVAGEAAATLARAGAGFILMLAGCQNTGSDRWSQAPTVRAPCSSEWSMPQTERLPTPRALASGSPATTGYGSAASSLGCE